MGGQKILVFRHKKLWSGYSLSKRLSFKLISEARDTDGRLLCLDINMAVRKCRLIDVYMHNDPDLEGYLITPRKIVLGGNYNFVENIECDKMGAVYSKEIVGQQICLYLKTISSWWTHFVRNFQKGRRILDVRVPFMFGWICFIFRTHF